MQDSKAEPANRKTGHNSTSFCTAPRCDLTATRETSEIFGTIKDRIKKNGTPIPINDVWIAAHVTESGAHLLTYDSHFAQVPGILLWQK